MSISDYLENVLLNLSFGAVAWPGGRPATHYIALYTSPPSDSGGGTQVSGGGYARKSVSANGTNYGVTAMVASNNLDISFTAATAAWGTVTHFGIFDAASGGNLLFWAPLAAEKTVAIGDTITIAAGAMTFTFGGNVGAKLGNQLANYIFIGTTFTNATHYYGLGTASTASTITGEGSGNGYARPSFSNNAANYPAAASGLKTNGAAIAFPTATGSWGGPFTSFIIANHPTTADDTTILWYGNLDQSRTPASTDVPKFLAGDLQINLD